MMKFFYTIFTIGYRDILKFFRDRGRIVATFIFPAIFIGVLGNSLNSNLGHSAGYNFLTFTFTGVLAQTLFQSSASGVISLIEDRENDFSQEIFVSPISRYSIIVGKILGESIVALLQAIGVIAFGFLIGAQISMIQVVALIPVMIISCLFGASFGILVLSNLSSQRSANLIFPFILFPQYFLAGVISPIKNLPWYLDILSKISPLTYIVDFLRSVFYYGKSEYNLIVLNSPLLDLSVIVILFVIFVSIGTWLFVKNERNK